MSTPSLTAIRAFTAAAQAGSLTTAGERLCVSHSAVSHQIRLLEEALGCVLFDRHSHGVSLTEAGRSLYAVSGRALADIEQACQQLQARHSHPTVTLACPGSFLMQWLIPRLDAFHRRHPGVTLRLQADADLAQLHAGRIDALLVFRQQAPAGAELSVLRLADNDLGPICAPAPGKRVPTPRTLLARPLLASDSHPQAWRYWAQARGLAPPAAASQRYGHFMYLIQAAIAGLGVGVVPSLLVSRELAEGRLVAPLGFVRTGHGIWLATRTASADLPGLAELRHWLLAEIATSQATHAPPSCQAGANSA